MKARTQDTSKTSGILKLFYLYLHKNEVTFSNKNCQPVHI